MRPFIGFIIELRRSNRGLRGESMAVVGLGVSVIVW